MDHEFQFPKLDTDRPDYKIRLNLYYNPDRGPRRGYFLSVAVIKQEDRFWLAAPLHKSGSLIQLEHVDRYNAKRFDEWCSTLTKNMREHVKGVEVGEAIDKAIALAPTVNL